MIQHVIWGGTVSSYRIGNDGSLELLENVAGWRINDDGSLTKIGEFGGLPDTVDGDHAPFDFSALGSPAGIDVL